MIRRIAFFVLVVLSVAAAAQATVRGRVLRADTGQPYAGVQVTLRSGMAVSAPAYTDGSGMFYLQNVPAGSYMMQVQSRRRTISFPVRVTREAYTDVPAVTTE